MMEKTEIYLIRHGQTEWNQAHRFQGHLDSPLTPGGVQQVEALAKRLKTIPFDAIYSSDLDRAYQTAKIIANFHGNAIITDKRLRERCYGIFEGLTQSEISEKYPEVYQAYKREAFKFVIPGAESCDKIVERTMSCLNELVEKHSGQRILVVSHGGIIGRFIRIVLGIPLQTSRHFRVANAGINVFTHRENCWRLETLGEISFMDENIYSMK